MLLSMASFSPTTRQRYEAKYSRRLQGLNDSNLVEWIFAYGVME